MARTLEFPGAMDAGTARNLANAAAERAAARRETLNWRLAEIDPAIVPGAAVRVPGHPGAWRIESWEWCDTGVELELSRLPHGAARESVADAGAALTAPDLSIPPTLLLAYELPWDGRGDGSARQVFAAASAVSAGWRGAALYAERGGELEPLSASGARRARIGHSQTGLPGSSALLFEAAATLEVQLASPDFILAGASVTMLAAGANRILLGEELVQFAGAEHRGDGQWRLTGLLRGRGGTEAQALAGHPPGTPFVLLDEAQVPLDATAITGASAVAAMGIGDTVPVLAAPLAPGRTLRPLTPVHPRVQVSSDGALTLRWTRRARGAWTWPDEIETPLNEETESYIVGLGPDDAPLLHWIVAEPALHLPAAGMTALSAAHRAAPFWVRQSGRFAQSAPLFLTTVP